MKKVLVVDDSAIALAITRRFLEVLGFEVTTLDSPAGFVSTLRESKPDFILLDVEMPAVDGPKLIEIARSHRLLDGVPVVLLSSKPEVELQALVRTTGAAGAVRKSDDGGVFWQQLSKALGISPEGRERQAEKSVSEAARPVAPSFSTGVAWLDGHHRFFFDELERIERAASAGELEKRLPVSVGFLARYATFHFASEESWMTELQYPEADAHRRQHEEFRLMARRMADRLAREGASAALAGELQLVVRRWLMSHIETFDRAVAEYGGAAAR